MSTSFSPGFVVMADGSRFDYERVYQFGQWPYFLDQQGVAIVYARNGDEVRAIDGHEWIAIWGESGAFKENPNA